MVRYPGRWPIPGDGKGLGSIPEPGADEVNDIYKWPRFHDELRLPGDIAGIRTSRAGSAIDRVGR